MIHAHAEAVKNTKNVVENNILDVYKRQATGYPIAKVAAKIALGYTLDEIENAVTKKTKACFEPTLDYVVVKIPKWPFDKFKQANRRLGTKMMATGEIMSIGSNFEAALLKGIRSLEIGKYRCV